MNKPASRWKQWQRPLASTLLGALLMTGLSGCFPLLVGGAVTGTLAASDRRTLGAQTEDKAIEVKSEIKLQNLVGDAGHINVNSFNRRALLTGEVRDAAMKDDAERTVRGIEGVASVANELEVAGISSYTSRSSDTLITTKVKASLIDAKDISSNSFDIVTERGNVYLMGRVTQREGDAAAEIARGVSGVQRVVKIFEYISEEEWRQYQPKPAAASTASPNIN